MPDFLMIICGALLNAAVVWGVVRTEMKYMRRDIDFAHRRIDALINGKCLSRGV